MSDQDQYDMNHGGADDQFFKFHATCGENKKMIVSALGDLQSAVELKFSLSGDYKIQVYLPEVEDYIDWDEDTREMIKATPEKIWKMKVEIPTPTTTSSSKVSDSYNDSPQPQLANTKLYVGHIAEGAKDDDLKKLFDDFGDVVECDVLGHYAFVHFKKESDARLAVKGLNNTEFMGQKIKVQISTSTVRQKPGMGNFTCYRCGKDGHWTRDCPMGPINRGGGGRGGGGRGGDHYDDPYYSDSYNYRSFSASERFRPYGDPYERRRAMAPGRDPYTPDPYSRDVYARPPPGYYRRSSDPYSTDPYRRAAYTGDSATKAPRTADRS